MRSRSSFGPNENWSGGPTYGTRGTYFVDLNGDRKCTSQFLRAAGNELTHVLTRDVLHRDIKDAVRLVKIVDRADVWVIELGAKLGFSFEASEVRGLLRQLGRENLDNDGAVELRVESLVDRPLAARADLFEYLVLVNLGTNHRVNAKCRVQNAE